LKSYLNNHPSKTGFFIETAHPAKFTETVETAVGEKIALPPNLQRFANGVKKTVEMPAMFTDLKVNLIKEN